MIGRIFTGLVIIGVCLALYAVYGYRYVLDDIRETAPAATIMGPPAAPISIVAYLDYGSSWSRRAHPVLLQVLAQNPDVNIIIKPFAGVAENSEYAARLAFAALQDNRFLDVHSILMESPRALTRDYISRAIAERGMDYLVLVDRADSDLVNDMISEVKREALFLGIDATPQLYVENVSLTGSGYDVNTVEQIIQDVRRGRR